MRLPSYQLPNRTISFEPTLSHCHKLRRIGPYQPPGVLPRLGQLSAIIGIIQDHRHCLGVDGADK